MPSISIISAPALGFAGSTGFRTGDTSASSSPKSIFASLRLLPLKMPERRFFFVASVSVPSDFLRRKTLRAELPRLGSALVPSGSERGLLAARRPGLGEWRRRSA